MKAYVPFLFFAFLLNSLVACSEADSVYIEPQLAVVSYPDSVAFTWIQTGNFQQGVEVLWQDSIYQVSMDTTGFLALPYAASFTVDPRDQLGIKETSLRFDPLLTGVELWQHQIAQMILVGVRGQHADEDPDLLSSIQRDRVGGILVFEKNLTKTQSEENLRTMIETFQSAHTKLPIIVAIDQEGGKVNRLKEKYGFPASVTASFLGERNDLELTYEHGRRTAKTLQSLGINVNFAPVVDLCKNPNNPIIAKYGRCYSGEPEVVVQHALQTIKGHHDFGVQTVIKHFPGHGSSHADTHEGMADVTQYWGPEEIQPFRSIIDSGYCDAVMTAHIINYQLNPDSLPATLSKKVNGEILRGDLGFGGLIFSDDMQMKAISEQYGWEEAIDLAVNSGVDVLIFSNNIAGVDEQTIDEVYRVFELLLESGRITPERLDASYQRIVSFKRRFP
ncbi:MAG: glycoside hydrolase family 3 N-terminal domain-containing protein [Bacteroidota bacterium]